MKKFMRIIGVLALIFFILGFLVTVYYTYFLMPVKLTETLGLEGTDKLDLIKEAITPTLVVIFVELVLGFLVIISMASNQNVDNTKEFLENMLKENQFQIQDSKQDTNAEDDKKDVINKKIETFIIETQNFSDKRLTKIFNLLCENLEVVIGALYIAHYQNDSRFLVLRESFAFQVPDSQNLKIEFGEGIAGQTAKEGKAICIKNVPKSYLKAFSGLGEAAPTQVLIVPIKENEKVIALMEVATFHQNHHDTIYFIENILNHFRNLLV